MSLAAAGLALLSALLGVGALAGAAQGRAQRPALGDWEGTGPHGLPLSFDLARQHRHLVVRDLAVGYPQLCPNELDPTSAVPFTHATYFGSRKSVDITAHADSISTDVNLSGRLRGRRHLVLSMAAPSSEPKGCWPKGSITYKLRPGTRPAITSGTWTGQLGGLQGFSLVVDPNQRVIDDIAFPRGCGGSSPPGALTAAHAFEFITASGSFVGAANFTEGGVIPQWAGEFGPDGVLRGTFSQLNQCPGASGSIYSATFTARPSG